MKGGAWPKEYNGKLFMGNLHGHRINVDVITPKGSGYVADRNPDFLLRHFELKELLGDLEIVRYREGLTVYPGGQQAWRAGALARRPVQGQ